MGSRYGFVGLSQCNPERHNPWLSNAIDQHSASAGVWFRPRQRWWWWLWLWPCDVFNVFGVGKPIQVFNWILVSVEFTTLGRFNASGRTANSLILLARNLGVFRMVWFDKFKLPAVWGEFLSASKFGALERSLLWSCQPHARSGVSTAQRDQSFCWGWASRCLSSRYFQLTWEVYRASTPSQGRSLHPRSCKNAACTISHNTMNKMKSIKNP